MRDFQSTCRRLLPARLICGLLAACCSLAAAASECVGEDAASALPGPPKENFHVYLLLGQSNMAGRGQMTAADRRPVEGVYAFDAENNWQPAAHPLHFDKPSIAGVGLGIDFAKTMRERDPNVAIGLIPCAVGGTRLDQWSRGGKLYEAALARARAGQQAGELKGVLWHQGESDSTDKLSPTYGARLSQLINDLRRDLNQPELPFVVGELGYFRRDAHPPTDEINRQLHALDASDRRIAVATAQGLRDSGDKTHFDAESLRQFGRRYGESMLRAIEDVSPSPKED